MEDRILKAIENVLNRAFPNHIVEDYSVKSGSSHGDNYLGVMYSIQATLKCKKNGEITNKKLILKTSPENQCRKDIEEKLQLFKKEAGFYIELIPELQKFQVSIIADPRNYIDLAFVSCNDVFIETRVEEAGCDFPWKYILMEDLREAENGGYKMACRITGLDYKHCELVIIALAKYHALSYAYMKSTLDKSEDIFQRFSFLKETMFTDENKSCIEEIYKSGSDASKRFFKKYFPDNTAEFNTLRILVDGVYNIASHFVAGSNDLPIKEMANTPAKLSDPNMTNRERKFKNQWLVVSHGDCWVNNFLFKYTDNTPTAVKLVDLQISREICLTTDLTYFFLMSTTGETRKKYLDQLLAVYFNQFMDTCNKLQVKPWTNFTLNKLKEKFKKNFCFGASTACAFLSLIILPQEHTVDMEKESGKDGSFFGSVFSKAADLENDNLKSRLISIVQESIAADRNAFE